MNTNLGLIGKKLGNTQIFNEDGTVTRVTAVKAGNCRVLGKRTVEKDGYSALQLAYGTKKAKHVNRPMTVAYQKIGQEPAQVVREFRLPAETVAKFEVGQTLKLSDIFTVGQMVDVCGQTRGRGFTGVMVRWNFKGSATATHGTHEYQRHGGSIGTNMTPGRTFPNLKMPGHYGNERVTILNLKIAKIFEDEGILLIAGAVPGSRNGIVTVRGAVKAPKSKA
jgi:large subunit ribosomal protein L3